MIKGIALIALLTSAPAPAQLITSYSTNNPAPVHGDANKLVCQKEETIGTRLGGKKVCLTVSEWRARQEADRNQTADLQNSTRAPCAEDPTCGLRMGPANIPR